MALFTLLSEGEPVSSSKILATFLFCPPRFQRPSMALFTLMFEGDPISSLKDGLNGPVLPFKIHGPVLESERETTLSFSGDLPGKIRVLQVIEGELCNVGAVLQDPSIDADSSPTTIDIEGDLCVMLCYSQK